MHQSADDIAEMLIEKLVAETGPLTERRLRVMLTEAICAGARSATRHAASELLKLLVEFENESSQLNATANKLVLPQILRMRHKLDLLERECQQHHARADGAGSLTPSR